jgi:GT2 family glycosyltransferase
MSEKYGLWARSFDLAYAPENYLILEDLSGIEQLLLGMAKSDSEPFNICVYARDHTPRRCVSLALAGLEILAQSRSDFVVHFFGQDQLSFTQVPYKAVNHGVLDADQLALLYNYCDLGVSFSGTNYSLVPQEMMACGLPLVELEGDSTAAVFPAGVVQIAPVSPSGIANSMAQLLDSQSQRQTIADKALQWVGQFCWEKSGRLVESAIKEYLGVSEQVQSPYVNRVKGHSLDVGIPTYNGLKEIVPVIEALRRQKNRSDFQIHCIDSSSSDGTTQWLRQQSDIALTVIKGQDFQHGRTRNDLIGATNAPLFAFLTQDATPATDAWATDILMMFGRAPYAGALFGRHIAYHHHSKWTKYQMHQHFAGFLNHPLCVSKATDPIKWSSGDIGWRQFLHFFSDNNAVVNRLAWSEIPYPHVAYGEDQVWANSLIHAGWSKLYSPTAAVFHSHEYTTKETFDRSKIESIFFQEHFGYRIGSLSPAQSSSDAEREILGFRRWGLLHQLSSAEIQFEETKIIAKHEGWNSGLLAASEGMNLEEALKR